MTNWLANTAQQRAQQTNINYGDLRADRESDRNNFEHLVGNLTSQFDPALQLQIAVALGLVDPIADSASNRQGGTTYVTSSGRQGTTSDTVRVGDREADYSRSKRIGDNRKVNRSAQRSGSNSSSGSTESPESGNAREGSGEGRSGYL